MMAAPKGITKAQIKEALKKKGGNVTHAAESLGLTRTGLYHHIWRDEELKQLMEDSREAIVDIAESALLKAIKRGNIAAIIFTLKTQGKNRGYVERVEQVHRGSLEVVKGYANVSPDEWPEHTTNGNLQGDTLAS